MRKIELRRGRHGANDGLVSRHGWRTDTGSIDDYPKGDGERLQRRWGKVYVALLRWLKDGACRQTVSYVSYLCY
jgi:hypothetical protein